MIEIRVDGEPVGKGRPRFSRATGRTYTPEKTASFENKVAWAAQQVMRGLPLMQGPLVLRADFYFTIPASWSKKKIAMARVGMLRPTGRPDFDNAVKAVCDALNRVVWVDDGQIVDGHITKWYSDRPHIKISIDNLSEEAI